ncbi:MAG: YebC/PmpR family DNA-binding transcriptional regulator [Saprospiraceae bacterium]|mgnify:FL=1|nr:YebC/PmpR family DNA-binding transcriptional regulator [Candidatus Opimibacter skivensis]MBP6681642.1 YebC/PmpR family DNA-binding transcriptional regulator [Saprospiraceae bacterium]
MGRIFEVRKSSMFARYDRMAKQFTRIGKEIAIAVKASGPDPDNNSSLRRAMQNAKSVNMPKDKVEAAIKRAMGKDMANYEEVMYEGYGPHGVAVIVEAATDNIVRTVANVRSAFNKGNGALSTSGSVSFQFNKMGVFNLSPENLDPEALELDLIDHGLQEMGDGVTEDGKEVLVVRCAFADFGKMQKALEDMDIKVLTSQFEWIPSTTVELPEDQAEEVLKLMARLEADEDVQHVFHNLA